MSGFGRAMPTVMLIVGLGSGCGIGGAPSAPVGHTAQALTSTGHLKFMAPPVVQIDDTGTLFWVLFTIASDSSSDVGQSTTAFLNVAGHASGSANVAIQSLDLSTNTFLPNSGSNTGTAGYITMGGLTPNTLYNYSVTLPNSAGGTVTWNGSVTTAPGKGNGTTAQKNFSFAFDADPQDNVGASCANDFSSVTHFFGHSLHTDVCPGNHFKLAQLVANQILNENVKFLLTGGDFGLNGGVKRFVSDYIQPRSCPGGTNSANSAVVNCDSPTTPLLSNLPTFPVYGNHDWFDQDSLEPVSFEAGLPHQRNMLSVPNAEMFYDAGNTGVASLGWIQTNKNTLPRGIYYSFNYGNTHFVVLSTGVENDTGVWQGGKDFPAHANIMAEPGVSPAELLWLVNDLFAAKHDASIRHIIVAGHNAGPLSDGSGYTNVAVEPASCVPNPDMPGSTCDNFNIKNVNAEAINFFSSVDLHPLFKFVGVELVLYGHRHDYEHKFKDGVHYISAPPAGGGLPPPVDVDKATDYGAEVTAGYSAVALADLTSINQINPFWGYVRVDVTGDTMTVTTKQTASFAQPGSTLSNAPAQTVVDTFTIGLKAPNDLILTVTNPNPPAGSIQLTWNDPNPVGTEVSSAIFRSSVDVTNPLARNWVSVLNGTDTTGANSSANFGNLGLYHAGDRYVFKVEITDTLGTTRDTNEVLLQFPACAVTSSTSPNSSYFTPGDTYNPAPLPALKLTWDPWVCSGYKLDHYQVDRYDTPSSKWSTSSQMPWRTYSAPYYQYHWETDIDYWPTDVNSYRVTAITTDGFRSLPLIINGWGYAGGVAANASVPEYELGAPIGLGVRTSSPDEYLFRAAMITWDMPNNYAWDSSGTIRIQYALDSGGATTAPPIDPTTGSLTAATVITAPELPYNTTNFSTSGANISGNAEAWATGIPCGQYWFQVAYHDIKNGNVYRYGSPVYYSAQCPVSPTGPGLIYNSSTAQAVASWTLPDGAAGAVVTRTSTTPPSSKVFTLPAQLGNSFTDSPDYAGVSYTYSVASYYYDQTALGQLLYSDPITLGSTTATANYSGCAAGVDAQVFGSGVVGCNGTVTWDNRDALCGPEFTSCGSSEWVHSGVSLAPTHSYWTNDNLNYGYDANGSCWAAPRSGTSCGTTNGIPTPMRICPATSPDPDGNRCNINECGFQTGAPNDYFGGCVGNTTAGTLCCRRESTCSPEALSQQYIAPGVWGCAGKVTFDQRANLCRAGTAPCSAAQWTAQKGSATPTHSYWTNDALNYIGSSTACAVSTTTGTGCGALTPMRVCPPTSPDPEGNLCNWTNCGYGATTPDEYFGGCGGNTTAGTLCCDSAN